MCLTERNKQRHVYSLTAGDIKMCLQITGLHKTELRAVINPQDGDFLASTTIPQKIQMPTPFSW